MEKPRDCAGSWAT